MRTLALDWGEVRVGAAISDEGGSIAFALDKFIDGKKAIDEIKKIVDEQTIEKIIVGLPKNLDGTESISQKKVEEFVASLKKVLLCPIELVDERFSSVGAGKTLSDQGMSEKKQRSVKDNIAAQLMLQTYLDRNK